jgi:hypothetical protein
MCYRLWNIWERKKEGRGALWREGGRERGKEGGKENILQSQHWGDRGGISEFEASLSCIVRP